MNYIDFILSKPFAEIDEVKHCINNCDFEGSTFDDLILHITNMHNASIEAINFYKWLKDSYDTQYGVY